MTRASSTSIAIAGVINVSPESPNRASVAATPLQALRLAHRLVRDGASLIDVGGRSSSPDSAILPDSEEQRRVLPVVAALAGEGYRVSVDTWSSETGILALGEGAQIVNFTGQVPSEALLSAMASNERTLCLSSMPYGDPYRMRSSPPILPTMPAICASLSATMRMLPAGLVGRLMLDPNIGMLHAAIRANRPLAMAWRMDMLSKLDMLAQLGAPLMIALPRRDGPGATRMWALAILRSGAACVRTHHPAVVVEMAAILDELERGEEKA